MTVPAEGFELASRVDDLGRQGMSQDAIAAEMGFSDKWGLFRALKNAGYRLALENRVRLSLTGERLSDLIESGDIAPAPELEGAVPA